MEAALLLGLLGYGVHQYLGHDDKSEQTPQAVYSCLLYTSPSPRDRQKSRMPSSA